MNHSRGKGERTRRRGKPEKSEEGKRGGAGPVLEVAEDPLLCSLSLPKEILDIADVRARPVTFAPLTALEYEDPVTKKLKPPSSRN